ncbi:MAG: hypothetical protein NZ529_02300 [Cytophagaceae bacterium]|nr:hypothetical protein [Cytophagaceae bacterium]MDW8455600.1 hypothetical protein [Cytophagaceae bacterium]
MKAKSIILVLAVFLSASFAYSQEEMFKVLASKGGNKLQTSGTTEWKPLFVGKKLLKGDKIIIAENGYLGLVHKTGKTIELKKPGTYEVAKLNSEVAVQNTSASKRYVDYVAGEMSKSVENGTASRYKNMAVTGSVERGLNEIKLFVPVARKDDKNSGSDKNITIFSSDVTIRWEAEPETKTYVVKVTNLFDDVIYSTETNNTWVNLKLDKKLEKNYKLTVSSKEKPNVFNEINLSFLPEAKSVEINNNLKELISQLDGETAINKIVLASFYEDNKLYIEALESYEAAIKMEPEVEDYMIARNQFLERANIAKPVEEKK